MAERPDGRDRTAVTREAGRAGPSADRDADARAARLAAQLKANLRRRKEQARGRAAREDEDR